MTVTILDFFNVGIYSISAAVLSCVSNEAQIRGRRFFETRWSKMGMSCLVLVGRKCTIISLPPTSWDF